MMFDIEYNLVDNIPYFTDTAFGKSAPTYRLQHLTLLFHTFVLMNLFNMFNCRVIGNQEDPCFNVFAHISHNWWFLIALLIELNVQYAMISYPAINLLFMTTPLTLGMHLTAFLLGAGSLLVAYGVKKTPFKWTEKIPKFEEKETETSLTRVIDNKIKSAQKIALNEPLL